MLRRLVITAGVFAPIVVAFAAFVFLAFGVAWTLHEVSPPGTANRVAKFSGGASVADSTITDDGTTVTLSTPMSMASHKITNVTDPTSAQEAATKNYVDTHPTGGMAIGGTVTSGTAGAVPYIGAGPVLAQDAAQMKYNIVGPTDHGLELGTDAVSAAFANYPLTVSNANGDVTAYFWSSTTAGLSALGYLTSARALGGILGYANSTYATVAVRNNMLMILAADLSVVDESGSLASKFFKSSGAIGQQYAAGNSATSSAASTMKFRYDTSVTPNWSPNGAVDVSVNGGAYGHVLFAQPASSPNVSSCGTGPTSTSTNNRWTKVTTGTGATGCTITYPSTLTYCNVTHRNGTSLAYSLSAATVTATAVASETIDFNCE